jgi:hypothetical protein
MRRLMPVALALALAPSASAALPNPCALLTNAQVAKIFGSKVETRTVGGNRLYRTCTWDGPGLGTYGGTHPQLMLQVTHGTKGQFDKSAKRTPGAVRVNGLGEAAFTANNDQMLYVLQHGTLLSFFSTAFTTSIQVDKSLARAALKRL